jgi:uridine kinase
MQCKKMYEFLARQIVALERPHPVRIGIDGAGASGKTMLADALSAPIEALGRPVIRAGVDGFHHPRAHRVRKGADCPVGYYADSFDYGAMSRDILEPLGPEGSRRYREAAFDFRTDSCPDHPWRKAPENAILLFEGVFLFRPELDGYWDYRIFVATEFDVTRQRAMSRDEVLMGGADVVSARYDQRYIPGQQFYLDEVDPESKADVVIDNNDPFNPQVLTGVPVR